MKKVLLAILAVMAFAVVSDASAAGWGRRCRENSCYSPCETRCEKSCNTPTVKHREVKPCGEPPCCLVTTKMPAELVEEVSYRWQCPNGCVEQGGAID